MKIYLVRHGQSEGNVRNLWYGRTDLPLTELGRQQARQAGAKLRDIPFTACYASPLSRAHETARLVMEGRTEPMILVPDLQEQFMGELETMSVPEIGARDADYLARLKVNWIHMTPPGGEPFDTGLAVRVGRALDAIAAKGEDCLIVAHNGPLCFAITHLLQLPIDLCTRFYLEQGCYSMIEIDPEIWNASHTMLRKFNA